MCLLTRGDEVVTSSSGKSIGNRALYRTDAMLHGYEEIARDSGVHLLGKATEWVYDEDSPHITPFEYEVRMDLGETVELETDEVRDPIAVGSVDGYTIAQDSCIESDLALWEEADAMDGDVVSYVEALIREMRACELVFEYSPDILMVQRITMVRHVEVKEGISSAMLMQQVVSALATMHAPVLMLVDPWPLSEERRLAKGKLEGRGHVPRLLEIGFVRMVGSRFLWAWNRQLSAVAMADYSYERLLSAKRQGALDEVLKTSLFESVYGDLSDELARRMGIPSWNDLLDE